MIKWHIGEAAILVVFLLCISSSCAFNSEEELYGIPACDTTIITWEYPIREILKQNCVHCHNAEVQNGGVRHDVYQLELMLVNDGRLNGVVNHLPGYPQMPYLLPKLPECELLLINTWIERGAPKN